MTSTRCALRGRYELYGNADNMMINDNETDRIRINDEVYRKDTTTSPLMLPASAGSCSTLPCSDSTIATYTFHKACTSSASCWGLGTGFLRPFGASPSVIILPSVADVLLLESPCA